MPRIRRIADVALLAMTFAATPAFCAADGFTVESWNAVARDGVFVRAVGMEDIVPISQAGYSQHISFADRKCGADLLAAINDGLAAVQASGELAPIHDKWLGVLESSGAELASLAPHMGIVVALISLLLSMLLLRLSPAVRLARVNAGLERRAHASDEALKLAIEELNEPICITDAEDRIMVSNRAFRRLNANIPAHNIGCTYEEHLRAGLAAGSYPDAAGQEEGWLAQRLARRREGVAGFEVPRKDGHWLIVSEQHLPGGGIVTFALDITERKRAENSLRRQTERLLLAQRMAHMIVLEWDIAADALEWSDSPDWLRGPLPATGKYPFFKDQVHPEDRERFLVTRQRATDTLEAQVQEYRFIRTDGQVLWVRSTDTVVASRDGKAERLVVALLDISRRKLEEKALAASEARFRALTELSSDWYWEQDEQFRFVELSKGVEGATDVRAAEYVGRTHWELMDGGMTPGQMTAHRTTLDARRSFRDFEYCWLNQQGKLIWVSISGDPVFDQAGRFTGYRGVGRNITQSKRLEARLRAFSQELELGVLERTARLRESETRLLGLLDALPTLIYCKGRDGSYLMCNRAAAALHGRTPEAMVGLTIESLGLDEGTKATILDADRRMHESRELQSMPDLRFTDRKGRERVLLNLRVPFRYSDKHPDCVLVVASEVTQLRATELELRLLNEDLEQRIMARTQELAATNRELESFSYTIAHDLRAPLRAIHGLASIASEDFGDRLPAPVLEYLERLRTAAARMGHMIDDLLSLSRFGRQAVRRTDVDLAALARDLVAELAAAEPGRSVRFDAPEALPASVDAGLMRVALQNLLGNAWKFTRRTVAPRIEFGAADTERGRAWFVRDNGAGFDMNHNNRLFGVFQRLHSHEEFEGTGVGLATVRRIVERHGGTIWAESTPGAGATFWFTIAEEAHAEGGTGA